MGITLYPKFTLAIFIKSPVVRVIDVKAAPRKLYHVNADRLGQWVQPFEK